MSKETPSGAAPENWGAEEWEHFLTGSDIPDSAPNSASASPVPTPASADPDMDADGIAEVHTTTTDWQFDDSEYHAHILINGTRDEFFTWLRILKSRGYRHPVYGEAYRASSSGDKFDWRIRVTTEDGAKPTREEMYRIFGHPIAPNESK